MKKKKEQTAPEQLVSGPDSSIAPSLDLPDIKIDGPKPDTPPQPAPSEMSEQFPLPPEQKEPSIEPLKLDDIKPPGQEPDLPGIVPDMPPAPQESTEQSMQSMPDMPEQPSMPEMPEQPSMPEMSDQPSMPEMPDQPSMPEMPEQPSMPDMSASDMQADKLDLPDMPEMSDTDPIQTAEEDMRPQDIESMPVEDSIPKMPDQQVEEMPEMPEPDMPTEQMPEMPEPEKITPGKLINDSLYVNVDVFRSTAEIINSLSDESRMAEEALMRVKDITLGKEKIYDRWQNDLEQLERELIQLDKMLFNM